MSKAHERPGSARSRTAGRTGIGLALAATTAVSVAVPAHAAPNAATPTMQHGATALTPAALTAATSASAVPAAPVMTYRVQAGDTVSHIAVRTGTSIAAIVKANNLNSRALIRVGQTLVIPSPAGRSGAGTTSTPTTSTTSRSGITHTVKSGDTVSALAQRYGTTVAAIVKANNLNSRALIRVGERLTIPGASAGSGSTQGSGTKETAAEKPAPSTSDGKHTVRSGDTVSALAQRYGTTVAAIVKANNLNSRALIRVGQVLTIPGGSAGGTTGTTTPGTSTDGASGSTGAGSGSPAPALSYTIQAGDTISGLAQKYGTTVAAIRDANKLASVSLIFVGQKLIIPGETTVTPVSNEKLVPDTFLGRTYPDATVSAANANKATLLAMNLPSRSEMQRMVIDVARQMGVDPVLAQAHAYQESGFNHASVSPANAIGTMQVIPTSGQWASDLVGRQLDLLDPYDNVVAGVAIIRQLGKQFPNNLDYAIASYYQGAGAVTRYGLYDDTKRYVASVKAHMATFRG